MNINYKQPQFELFPANSATLEDINKPRFLLANLTLSVESLVIFAILGIMVSLFAFSLGVERGKVVAAQALDERVSAAWNVGARTIAPAVAAAPVGKVMAGQRLTAVNGYSSLNIQRALPSRTVNVPVAAGGRYTVQIATYGNQEYALQDARRLHVKNFQSFLIKNGKYWLLCVGMLNSKESAAALSKKLSGQFRSSQVRRF